MHYGREEYSSTLAFATQVNFAFERRPYIDFQITIHFSSS
jgi:hypothetical protein